MNRFDASQEFEKEFRRLSKKYKTLDDDLDKVKEILRAHPTGIGKNFDIVHSSSTKKIVKARMACRALRNRSLRLVYVYFEQERRIEFIEIYFKGDKENEDRERIKRYLDTHDI